MIRFATKNDIPRIMKFIDEYWKQGHILSRNQTLFEFQHVWKDEVSFVLAENRERNIEGVLGYIPYAEVDRDVMLAIWKTLKTENTMLGIEILQFLRKKKNICTISAPGINRKTRGIYEFLGIKTGKMKQWYRLRKNAVYRIARVKDFSVPDYIYQGDAGISTYADFKEAIDGFQLEKCLRRERQPYKSLTYLKRRYFQHPVFRYLKYGIELENKRLMIMMRVQPCNGSNALRVVDCIGDQELLQYFAWTLDKLMDILECEYADIYETGIDDAVLINGGWTMTSKTENIIPEYFGPFEQKNVDIYYMSEIPDVILFKGDGDMDRPN